MNIVRRPLAEPRALITSRLLSMALSWRSGFLYVYSKSRSAITFSLVSITFRWHCLALKVRVAKVSVLADTHFVPVSFYGTVPPFSFLQATVRAHNTMPAAMMSLFI